MYLDFYGFREKPFTLTPDPRFVFLSKNHREAFAHLLYGIENRVGFMVLTGEVGSGKTTVSRALLSQLDADRHRTSLIFNPCVSAPELLQNINREFGILTDSSSGSSLLDALNLFLLQQKAEGRTVVLVIDEAQNLEASVLEQIRLISNLETDSEKLIQIVLLGQPEFGQTLKGNEMRQLSQRITVRYHLQPMDFPDTVDYINHRLAVAGGKGGAIFSRGALKRIYRFSGGFPRLINAACDRALLAGYAKDTARINSRIVSAGITEIKRNTAPYPQRRRLLLIPTLVILAALLAAVVYFERPDLIDRFKGGQQAELMKKQIVAKEEQTLKAPAMTGEEFSQAVAAELGKVSEPESARRAFNILAGLWNVPPVPEDGNLPFNEMAQAALDRKLHLYRFSANLGTLLRFDCPAALELTVEGIPGKRFIGMLGMENEQLLVDPPIAGRKSLSFSDLEKHWSGQGFLLWRDPMNLLAKTWFGAKGSHIQRLQGLLKDAGAYTRPLTGVYDDHTLSAVKKFQSSKGIEQDGVVGVQTLILLYGSIGRFERARLTVGRK